MEVVGAWAAVLLSVSLWLFGTDSTGDSYGSSWFRSVLDSVAIVSPMAAMAFGYLVVRTIDGMQNSRTTPAPGLAKWLTARVIASAAAGTVLVFSSGLLSFLIPLPENSLLAPIRTPLNPFRGRYFVN